MKKIIFSTCFTLLFSLLYFQGVFGSSGEIILPKENNSQQIQTIRVMQEEIEELQAEKTKLEFSWSTFRIGNMEISEIIRELSAQEQQELETLIFEYQKKQRKANTRIERAIENNTLDNEKSVASVQLKKDFYESLLPYIRDENIQEYRNYISNDLKYNEKSKQVDVQIQDSVHKKNERIEEIQEKIEENNEKLRERINTQINITLRKRLDTFLFTERISTLSNEQKITLFLNLIERVKQERERLKQTSQGATSVIDEKIAHMELVLEILEEYIENWEKESK